MIVATCTLFARTPGYLQGDSPAPPAASQISGHVYRMDTHEPVGKAIVVLNPQSETIGAQQRVASTDAEGAFAFRDLVPAQYS